MTPQDLQSQIALGEDSKRQFKVDVRNAESLAAEMAAFANTEGGQILIGVADDGSMPGLIVTRKPVEDLDLVEADASEVSDLKGHSDHLSGQGDPINDLLNKIRETPNADYATLARVLQVSEATVKRNIQKLKQQNRIRRVGSKKTGHWEIME